MSDEEWTGLFDFTNPGIQQWEVEGIRQAEIAGDLDVSDHASKKATARNIAIKDLRATVRLGKAVEKDMPTHENRAPGILFRKTDSSQRTIYVKVGYEASSYNVITTYEA